MSQISLSIIVEVIGREIHFPDPDLYYLESHYTFLFRDSSLSGLTPVVGHSGKDPLLKHSLFCLSGQTQSLRFSPLCGVNAQWSTGDTIIIIRYDEATNLNGARIFRIIQQSDRAAVFPLKIPDAATHESAQHLLRESPLRVYRTRTINSTPACK